MRKPKVGVLLLSSGWMKDVGMDTAATGLSVQVATTSRRILAGLGEHCELVSGGVAASGEEAARAGRFIADANCDAVVVAPLVWVEDQVVRAALREVRATPLILATLIPHDSLPVPAPFQTMLAGSGTVGALQASGLLAREGRAFSTVAGRVSDASVYTAIATRARAAAASASLGQCRIGLLGGRCDAMSVTWVDEVGLRERHGVELVPLEISRLARVMRDVPEGALQALTGTLDRAGFVVECDHASLEQGMRAAIALEAMAQEDDLSALAMNDVATELHAAIGMRPCLPHPGLSEAGFVVSMEADVAAAVLMLVLQHFTGASPFYTEIFTPDPQRNALLMGHAGWHPAAYADPGVAKTLIADVEYRVVDRYAGAAVWYAYTPGPVTAVNAVWRDGGLRLSFFEGVSVGGAHLEGNCHLLCRIEEDVAHFLARLTTRGVSQHWIVVPGHHGADLAHLAAAMGVPLDR